MSDDTESTESLKGVIEKLRAKVAELEDKVSELEDAAASIGNLAGDEDTSPGNGYINVDTSVARHPVIRFRASVIPDEFKIGDYLKVKNKNDGLDDNYLELDARDTVKTNMTVKSQAGAASNLLVSAGGSGKVKVVSRMHGGLDDASLTADAAGSYLYLEEHSGKSVTITCPAGGKSNIYLSTNEATQGEVRIRECNLYDGSVNQPVKINVVASQAFDIGGRVGMKGTANGAQEVTSQHFAFVSKNDSNVVVDVSAGNNGVANINIGTYYR